MAVYTQLTRDQIEAFLGAYDCGALKEFEGIVQGVENTNYKIETGKEKFILTVFEARTNEADLPFFFDFMTHLHAHGIGCPQIREDRAGKNIQKIAGKAAALFSFLPGNNIDAADITPQKCADMGKLLARMHIDAVDFPQTRANSMSLPAWHTLYDKMQHETDTVAPGLKDLMQSELAKAQHTFQLNLPKAVCHLDAFPDNIFETDSEISGVIDFYFSATDFLVYDLAIALNAWCFKDGQADRERISEFLEAYQTLRPLTTHEKQAFQDVACAAALRILMTRAHDWIFHDPKNLVKPKDPLEYKRILEFHGQQNILS